jgi:hypothetical protein
LCANCHIELHHPEHALDNFQKFKELSEGIKRRKKDHDLKELDINL